LNKRGAYSTVDFRFYSGGHSMNSARYLVGLLCVAALWSAGIASAGESQADAKQNLDFFEKKIRPALVRNCYECHSGDAKKAKGGLVLDTRAGLRKGGESGAAVVPGHPDDSLLIEAVRYDGLEMPPAGKLPDETIADLVKWVEMGAADPRVARPGRKGLNLAEARKWWSFQKPKAVPPPTVANTPWARTDVDRFVLAALEKAGLKPVPDADPETLLRRVSFDLTGLPPSIEEIDAFMREPSESALAAVVDRLLDSPRFGERWGRHWLDVARYGESAGKERNVPFKYAWRYRDYVIDSFNADKPYDRFLVEQLAGDLLPVKTTAERNTLAIATGFLALGPKGLNEKNAEQYRMDVIDDQIDATTRGMLGLTVACARCHDHKFDPITTTDYYALAGIFRSTETLAGVVAGRRKDYLDERSLLTLADASRPERISSAEIKKEQAQRAEQARLQSQLAGLRAEVKKLAGQIKKQPKKGKRKAAFAMGAGPQIRLLRGQIKQIEARLAELDESPAPGGEKAMGVRDAPIPANARVLNRGEVKDAGPEVSRGVVTVLRTPQSGHINPAHSGRLEMARWIASADNPLTARVMVNRVWQHLFGEGLVPTVDNFGALGDEPSHPELLDTLAVQLMSEGWSIKRLIRSLVLSRVYRLSSQHDATNYAVDPSNRLLWRSRPRRLDAEEIRDAMLFASGRLDVARPQGSPVMQMEGNGKNEKMKGALAEWVNHRAVYLPMYRGNVPEALAVFDMADPSLIVGKREVTTVATQALFLMNSPFVGKQSEMLARRLSNERGLREPARIDLAYRLALGRSPSPAETARVEKYLKEYRLALAAEGENEPGRLAAWSSVCQALFASAEFRYLY
jgi:cytochrome c553